VWGRKKGKTSAKQGRRKRRPDVLLLGRQPFYKIEGNHGLRDAKIRPDYQLLCGRASAYWLLERKTVSLKTRRIITWSGVALFVLVVAAIVSGRGWFWAFCGSSPLTSAEIDINQDGRISFIEADYNCNCGTRQIVQEGRQCTEYFAYKDGLPLKVVCPAG